MDAAADDDVDDAAAAAAAVPRGVKDYISPVGHARLGAELHALLHVERPKIVDIVSWAAGNGDRSENGDYLYGKKRLREIDRRVRFLARRLERAQVVDPAQQRQRDRVFFGATVTCADTAGRARRVTILGTDEAELARGEVSLESPIACALLRARVGDVAKLATPAGVVELEVLAICYPADASGSRA